MPEKDPGLWAAVLAWLVAHQPQLSTGGIAAAVAMFRVINGGGRGRKVLLEGAICGLIAVSLLPVLEYFALPANLSVCACCLSWKRGRSRTPAPQRKKKPPERRLFLA
ncbi:MULTISPECIES: phage holin family protein [unclassified Pseudomonas]|uniref:phage holin family protein n=1 Tax=unclassified Pseudomonas TaxID=196821 RepID=UPI00209735FB|nr:MULTISPECIES: phage holin family protein [unclassified Pseudomonas]MCO7518329.1 phage holin family protein [Pseudomonas sp. 1]MCO7538777.1 phage holin family protein [Pseudomonas sp. VA159-2]